MPHVGYHVCERALAADKVGVPQGIYVCPTYKTLFQRPTYASCAQLKAKVGRREEGMKEGRKEERKRKKGRAASAFATGGPVSNSESGNGS